MWAILGIAARNLLQARRRTALLSLAIALVTWLLVLLLSMAAGIEDNLVDAATTLSAGDVNVGGFYKITSTRAAPLVQDYEKVEKIVRENTPGLDYVTTQQRGWAKLVSETGSMQVGLQGVDLGQEKLLVQRLALAPESAYRKGGGDAVTGDFQRLDAPHTAILFASQAKRLGVGPGDVVTIQTETTGGQTNTDDVTVVAVAKDIGLLSLWSVLVTQDEVRQLYGLSGDVTGVIRVYLKDIGQSERVMGHLRTVLAAHGYKLMDHEAKPFFMKINAVSGEDWTGQKLDVTIWRDEVSFLTWVLTAFDSVSWFLVVVLVAIIAVGITNTMWTSVRERTKEIGTMRAIGMQRRQVLGLILAEAGLLGLFATTCGAVLGALVALGVDAAHIAIPIQAVQAILLSDTLHLVVTPTSLLAAVGLLTLLTVLAGILPALRAASLQPVTAIQTVE